MKIKRALAGLCAAILLVLAGCSAGQTEAVTETTAAEAPAAEQAAENPIPDEDTIVIYTPHDADPMNAAVTAFMKKYPDIRVTIVAGGTGELLTRVENEAADPKADVFWGGGADSMEACKSYFETYTCVNDSAIAADFKDNGGTWIGESPLPMVIIYNKKLLAEAGAEAPTSWADCLNPVFKGKIAYCWPSKSGSAYTQLCTMILANGGGERGWAYVKSFVDNLDGKILDSSGRCHKLVASGEYTIGLTIEKSAALYADDPNIGFCYPSEGTSAVPDAIAVIKGCRHEANAKLFVDFVTSRDCQEEQCTDWERRPSRSDTAAPAGLPDLESITLVDYDFSWAANVKEEIIQRFNDLMGFSPAE